MEAILLLGLVAVGCLMLGGAGGMFVLLLVQSARERVDSRRIVESVWESYPEPLPCAHYAEPVDAEFEELTPRSTLAGLDDRDRPTGPLTSPPELTADDEPTCRRVLVNGAYHPEGVGKMYEGMSPRGWPHAGVYVWGQGAVLPPDALQPDGPLDVVGQAETDTPPAVQSGRYEVAS